ncbi:MAG: hypothetical protein KDH94_04150, partial [Coxiellaceae bacterium]|nr:hypothetical protein [Coxiellaceae bacterium]
MDIQKDELTQLNDQLLQRLLSLQGENHLKYHGVVYYSHNHDLPSRYQEDDHQTFFEKVGSTLQSWLDALKSKTHENSYLGLLTLVDINEQKNDFWHDSHKPLFHLIQKGNSYQGVFLAATNDAHATFNIAKAFEIYTGADLPKLHGNSISLSQLWMPMRIKYRVIKQRDTSELTLSERINDMILPPPKEFITMEDWLTCQVICKPLNAEEKAVTTMTIFDPVDEAPRKPRKVARRTMTKNYIIDNVAHLFPIQQAKYQHLIQANDDNPNNNYYNNVLDNIEHCIKTGQAPRQIGANTNGKRINRVTEPDILDLHFYKAALLFSILMVGLLIGCLAYALPMTTSGLLYAGAELIGVQASVISGLSSLQIAVLVGGAAATFTSLMIGMRYLIATAIGIISNVWQYRTPRPLPTVPVPQQSKPHSNKVSLSFLHRPSQQTSQKTQPLTDDYPSNKSTDSSASIVIDQRLSDARNRF